MKNIRYLFIPVIAIVLLLPACSKRVFEARQVQKLHDEYFIVRRNGHYSFKMVLFGVFRMQESRRGHSIRSADTIYFVTKQSKRTYLMYGYGIIDSSAGTFTYKFNDSLEWNTFNIINRPAKKRDR